MVTVTQKRKLGRDRTRRYREKLKGDGAIALTRRPSKNAPTEGESYSAWADRTLRLTAGPRRGEPWRCLSWQREPLDMAGRGGRIVVLRAAAAVGYEGWLVVEAEQDPSVREPGTYQSMGLAALRAMAREVGLDRT